MSIVSRAHRRLPNPASHRAAGCLRLRAIALGRLCAKLSPADHGLATELVMGVLRWQSLLDSQISRFSDKRLEKLDIEVLTALRLAAYQLLYLDRIPGRAAVHESVELVKRARKSFGCSVCECGAAQVGGKRYQSRKRRRNDARSSIEDASQDATPNRERSRDPSCGLERGGAVTEIRASALAG